MCFRGPERSTKQAYSICSNSHFWRLCSNPMEELQKKIWIRNSLNKQDLLISQDLQINFLPQIRMTDKLLMFCILPSITQSYIFGSRSKSDTRYVLQCPIHTSFNYYPWINPFLSIKSEEICPWDFFVKKKFTKTRPLI